MTPIEEEQLVVESAYRLLDRQRERTRQTLRAVLAERGDGTPAARSRRDAETARLTGLLARLDRLEERLVFGRIDTRTGADAGAGTCAGTSRSATTIHVGRFGLRDEAYASVVVDWRSPAAQGFYQATPARPGHVRRRRHLRVHDRRVTSVIDDLLVPDPAPTAARGEGLDDNGDVGGGEAALLAAVTAARTGRMHDAVATLQAEQDRIIRSPAEGVLVVEGGPGTGKTAVALHRAAYLLYTYRERLAHRGVLLIGPHNRFLAYIDDVLPGLGEDTVTSTTVGGLLPHIPATGSEPDAVAAVKGDPRMTQVLAAAVRQWPRTPSRPVQVRVEDMTLLLRPQVVRAAQEAARGARLPHNAARERFCAVVLDDLAAQLAHVAGEEDPDGPDRTRLLAMLHASPDVRREVNLCWMPLTAERVLARLWSDRRRLAAAASGILTGEEQHLLRRDPRSDWSPADVPLLDELEELVGPAPTTSAERVEAARAARRRAERVRFARESLTSLGLEAWIDPHQVADRYDGSDQPAGAEDRLRDRDRAWGHVVVDEAQDLSPMAWRMVLRRCPTRSMTVVGDLFQATAPAAPRSWEAVFDTHAPGRWRREELSVNYRTPGQISRIADQLAGRTTTARSLREGSPPLVVRLPQVDPDAVAAVLEQRRGVAGTGTTAVIVPDSDPAVWPPMLRGVPVLAADQVKGLEFDHVVIVEPAAIAREPVGRGRLYVALTRATQSLLLLHAEALPTPLGDLTRAGVPAGNSELRRG